MQNDRLRSRPRIGHAIVSTWGVTTFNSDAVKAIASEHCPKLRVEGDPVEIAAALNGAATQLLLSLSAVVSPTDARAWGRTVAERCADIRAILRPAHRVALRLGVDRAAVHSMLATLWEVEERAMRLATAAGYPELQTAAKRPSAESAWLESMEQIFRQCFNRAATIVRTDGDRGGNFARFTAEVARRLDNDASVHKPPAGWHKALLRFWSEKKVAGRLEHARNAKI